MDGDKKLSSFSTTLPVYSRIKTNYYATTFLLLRSPLSFPFQSVNYLESGKLINSN